MPIAGMTHTAACTMQVLTEMTSYAELHKGLQEGNLPIVEDRSGLVYNPLSSIEVRHASPVSCVWQCILALTLECQLRLHVSSACVPQHQLVLSA